MLKVGVDDQSNGLTWCHRRVVAIDCAFVTSVASAASSTTD